MDHVVIFIVTFVFNIRFFICCNIRMCPRLDCTGPVTLPGECCPTCPCPRNGYHYNIGDIVYTNNRCETCECTKWGIMCLPVPCPQPDCSNPVQMNGECCPQCGCLAKNHLYEIGEAMPIPSGDHCLTDCRCGINGDVVCERTECPLHYCFKPITLAGECCPKCGCQADDEQKFYHIGELMIVEDKDPCILGCRCGLMGSKVCDRMICPENNCSNPIQVPGQCCPQCGCLLPLRGTKQLYNVGDEMPVPDNVSCLINCRCVASGERACDQVECPPLNCSKPIQLPGECCAQCGCRYAKNETFYKIGEIMPSPDNDPCTDYCRCGMNEERVCEHIICEQLNCSDRIRHPGECCPVCSSQKTDKENFQYVDAMYKRKASDEDKQDNCDQVECPILNCSKPSYRPGNCCPVCGCIADYNNTLYHYGESMPSGDPCQDCVCGATGDPLCQQRSCPHVNCTNPVSMPDQCCPVCGCQNKTNILPFGPVSKDPCQPCTCLENGTVTCDPVIDCPELKCRFGSYSPGGECCPVCKCKYKQKIRLPGPVYEDACERCSCLNNGTLSCKRRTVCPMLKCKFGKYTPEGECCPKCKCRYKGQTKYPGDVFGPKCRPCDCNPNTGRYKCSAVNCPVVVNCVNPRNIHGDCCASCPQGPNCKVGNTIIRYGHYKEVGSRVCFCAGESWFPDAFCAGKNVQPALYRHYNESLVPYGYR